MVVGETPCFLVVSPLSHFSVVSTWTLILLVLLGLLCLLPWCSVFPITSSDLPDASPPPPTDYVYFENSSSNPYLVRRIEELNKVSGAESHPCPALPPPSPCWGVFFS